jgi:hypothetical protein
MGDEGAAGVVFHLEASNLKKSAKGYSGRAQLTAQVTDIELWNDLVLRLKEGLPLYRGKDIKEQVIEILQEDRANLQTESERKLHALRTELERALQDNSKLRSELRRYGLLPGLADLQERSQELERAVREFVEAVESAAK